MIPFRLPRIPAQVTTTSMKAALIFSAKSSAKRMRTNKKMKILRGLSCGVRPLCPATIILTTSTTTARAWVRNIFCRLRPCRRGASQNRIWEKYLFEIFKILVARRFADFRPLRGSWRPSRSGKRSTRTVGPEFSAASVNCWRRSEAKSQGAKI